MDLLDMSLTTPKGNRYVLVMIVFLDGWKLARYLIRQHWQWLMPSNRTLLMMLAMFAGENRDDWDDLLPAVMMTYRSSVRESTGYIPYRLMLGEECTFPMDVGLPR